MTCHCSLVPPCRLRSKGRSSLRKDTRRQSKIFHTYNCTAFFPLSFFLCLYKHLKEYSFLSRSLTMLVSSESLKITSSISWFLRGLLCWMTTVGTVDMASPGDSPAQQRAERRARSQSSGWLVTICLTCVVGQWLGVVGTKWRYLVFKAIRGGKGNGAVAWR